MIIDYGRGDEVMDMAGGVWYNIENSSLEYQLEDGERKWVESYFARLGRIVYN